MNLSNSYDIEIPSRACQIVCLDVFSESNTRTGNSGLISNLSTYSYFEVLASPIAYATHALIFKAVFSTRGLERSKSVLRAADYEPLAVTGVLVGGRRMCVIKISVFWDVRPYSLVDIYQRFSGSYYRVVDHLHHVWEESHFQNQSNEKLPAHGVDHVLTIS
jgi:hypothetical protein